MSRRNTEAGRQEKKSICEQNRDEKKKSLVRTMRPREEGQDASSHIRGADVMKIAVEESKTY